LIVEKIPLLVLVAISAAIAYVAQHRGGALGMLGEQVPLGNRLGNAIFSYGQYLEKCFWPNSLAAVYPYVNRRPIDVLTVGLALVAISVAAVRLAKIRPYLLVGWCWYLGTLVPVIGLVQIGMQSMADRYTYIPLIGIFIIAAWSAAEFTEEWPARNKTVAAVLVLAVCGWLAWRQVATWSSSEALYSRAVEAERYNLFALHGLGMAYWKEGKLDEAQQQFETMVKLQFDPTQHFEGGLEPGYRALGLLLAVRRQPRKALEQFDAAIHARPQQPEPLRHKAWLLATSLDDSVRDGRKAVQSAELALQLSSRNKPEYWDTLAAAQAEAGNFKEALASAEEALELARSTRADDLIAGIQERLELFRSGKPYHAEARAAQRP
jgi:tetratricopeptide (TPR) repeat protein